MRFSARGIRLTKFVLVYVFITVICAAVVFPFYWMAISSMTPGGVYATLPKLFTLDLDPSAYLTIWSRYPLGRWLSNSTLVALSTTAFSIVVSCFAAYSLSRFKYKGKLVFAAFLLGTQMIPFVVLVIPLYIIFRNLNLINSLLGLIVAYTAFAIPLCTMLLKGFFDSIPIAIEEAALMDGCSRLGSFLKITLPLSLPGLAVVALFSFLQVWNEYVIAATFLHNKEKYTVSVGVYSFIQEHQILWADILTTSIIITIPTFVVFAIIQKGLIKGLGTGALKG